jgi:ABC-type multidrug transport system fused ATPase/permease subunit
MVLTVLMAVFELLGVAAILPFLSLLAEPERMGSDPRLLEVADFFGLASFQEIAIGFGVMIFIVIIVGMMVRGLATYVQLRFAIGLGYGLSARLLQRHLTQNYDFYLTRNSAALSQNILSEIDLVVRENILPALLVLSNGIILILISGFLLVINPGVAIAALSLLIGVYVLVYFALRGRIQREGALRTEANNIRFKVVQEVTGSFKEVKIMGLEETSMGRFRGPAQAIVLHQANGLIMQRLPRFALEAMVYGGFVLMVLVLIVLQGGEIADLLPILGLLALSATKLFPALQQLYQSVASIRLSLPSLVQLQHHMEDSEGASTPAGSGPIGPLKEALVFRDVGFAYPGGEGGTLSGFDLNIPAGSSVGFVGGTGAGKTTVIDLLMGLLQPDTGTIEIDGTPMRAENIRTWQRSIGYVPQDIFLADATVAANIAFGLPESAVDMDRVHEVSRLANLHDFVTSELPEGYQTFVGERGLRLSGGQKQRIGIARALYQDPDVLVLDEATSALDNLTEQAVMDAVNKIGAQKTILMIAHRLTTVKACDKIVLLERGRVMAEGDYDTLIRDNATFRALAQAKS